MMFSNRTIRFLCSLLLLVGLLFGFSKQSSMAATTLAPLTQVSPSAEIESAQSSAYSAAQLSKIEKAAKDVQSLRTRLEAFQPEIKRREWTEVHKNVAGLLPDLKQKMMSVTDQLELNDRLLARAVSTEVFIHLERIDEADEVYDYQSAEINYLQALQDFDAFLSLLPKA